MKLSGKDIFKCFQPNKPNVHHTDCFFGIFKLIGWLGKFLHGWGGNKGHLMKWAPADLSFERRKFDSAGNQIQSLRKWWCPLWELKGPQSASQSHGRYGWRDDLVSTTCIKWALSSQVQVVQKRKDNETGVWKSHMAYLISPPTTCS